MRNHGLFASLAFRWSPFVCVFAIGTSLLVARQAITTGNPLGSTADVIAAGRVAFDQSCQSCHAPGAAGDRGPALNTGVFRHGSGTPICSARFATALAGTQMPPFRGLTDEQIWQLVAYLRSLSGVPAGVPAANATPPRGDRAAGRNAVLRQGRMRELSRSQRPRRHRRARPLDGGRAPAPRRCARRSSTPERRSPLPLRQAGQYGGRGGAGARAAGSRREDQRRPREIRGVRRNEDTFSLQMVDASGPLHLLDKLQLRRFGSRTAR